MKHKTLIVHSRDLAVDGGPVDAAGRSWSEPNVESLPGSAMTRAQNQASHPMRTRLARQSHDQEPPEPNRSTVTATHDNHRPENVTESGL